MKKIAVCFFLIVHLNCFCQVPVFPYRDSDGLWGAVDGNLKEVIAPSYSKMNFFINHDSEKAVAIVTDHMTGYKGLVNRRGEMLLKPEYKDLIYTYDEGGVILYQTYPDNRYGLYSIAKKKIVVNPVYEEAPASLHVEINTMLIVKQRGKYGVIHSDGTVVVPIQYDQIKPFSVEKCPWIEAHSQSVIVYYDCKGAMHKEKPVTSFEVSEFISIGGEQSLKDGNQVSMAAVTQELVRQKLGEKATILSEFQNGAGEHFAIVQADNKKGILDGNGVTRVPVVYDNIMDSRGFGGLLVIKDGLEGWIDIAPGKVIIEPVFKKLYVPYFSFGKVKSAFLYVVGVTRDNGEAFIELKTGKVFYPQRK